MVAGTDLPPVTLGHEFCGVVEKVGKDEKAVKAGDFVSAEMHVNSDIATNAV